MILFLLQAFVAPIVVLVVVMVGFLWLLHWIDVAANPRPRGRS